MQVKGLLLSLDTVLVVFSLVEVIDRIGASAHPKSEFDGIPPLALPEVFASHVHQVVGGDVVHPGR